VLHRKDSHAAKLPVAQSPENDGAQAGC